MVTQSIRLVKRDWLLILIFAIFFGFSKGYFYYMASYDEAYLWLSILMPFLIWAFVYISISMADKYLSLKNNIRTIFLIFISIVSAILGMQASVLILNLIGFIIKPPSEMFFAVVILCIVTSFVFYRIVYIRHEKERMEKVLAKAELNSTQMQLNPHFLFNSINTLSELIYQDQEKCERMLLCISDLLRQMTNSLHVITLKEEIEFSIKYIKAQNFRFDDTILLDIDDFNEFKDIKIPKYSISLLLENSVKHKNFDELIISVKFWQDSTFVCIAIGDNNFKNNINFGFGLQNLQERLNSYAIGDLWFENNSFIIKANK